MNTSGLKPTEYNVLIKPKQAKKKTSGGLLLPEDVTQKDGFAQTRGVIVAIGPMAFEFEDWPKGRDDEKPKIGDTVYFARYAGASSVYDGEDDNKYWIIKDRDILGIIESKED